MTAPLASLRGRRDRVARAARLTAAVLCPARLPRAMRAVRLAHVRYLRQRNRGAVARVREDMRNGVDMRETFARFMDTIVPGWRSP